MSGRVAVEDLVGPQHDDQLVVADVGDVVRPARHRLDDAPLAALAGELDGLAGDDVAKAEMRACPRMTRNFSVLLWW